MKIFKRAGKNQPTNQTPLQKRISRIGNTELITWAENQLFIVGKEVTGWMRTGNKVLLDEAETGAEALLEIVRELKRR